MVNKISSNITGLAYAEEAVIGVLPGEEGQPGTPDWKRLQPNSYSDFGGEIITVAPNPINPSRQRRKGVTTDLNASGGFNHNLTYRNLTDLMQGVMFADIRRKGHTEPTAVNLGSYEVPSTTGFVVDSLVKAAGFNEVSNNTLGVVTAVVADTSVAVSGVVDETAPSGAVLDVVGHECAVGDIDVDASGSLPALTSTTLDFTTLGLVVGQWVFLGGDAALNQFDTAANNGMKRIRSIAANEITFDKSDLAMVTEVAGAKEIRIFFGDVLRNESGTDIVRRTYQLERTLGAPDDAQPSEIQSEVLKGVLFNELTLNVPSAELVNVDLTTVAIDAEQREGSTGPKQSSVTSALSAKEYNTSSDIGRIRLAKVIDGEEAPAALFAFVMEATITINNNVTPDKAVGVLGAFDVNAGTFTVSGELTAYFADIAAVKAIRDNADVTLDMAFVKDNTGIVLDMPLIGLGNGRLEVEVDQSIKLPLTTDAASGEDVDTNLDHTLLITYFNYLPNAA